MAAVVSELSRWKRMTCSISVSRLSRCRCFRILDRRADKRFDIILLNRRSSSGVLAGPEGSGLTAGRGSHPSRAARNSIGSTGLGQGIPKMLRPSFALYRRHPLLRPRSLLCKIEGHPVECELADLRVKDEWSFLCDLVHHFDVIEDASLAEEKESRYEDVRVEYFQALVDPEGEESLPVSDMASK
ncbi:hypothetical protein M5K25_005802 [Dendrobium thyrsiflorum]|uniref:Uncharacterized protein n=1 Tax=Dendrobium thyrsiflorum TaxID=117978 RepID=A0ABD0VQ30_DENTH